MSKLVVFNWKMNLPILSSWKEAIKSSTPLFLKRRGGEVIVCPPFTHISKVKELLKGKEIRLGAQDVSIKDEGALTGEVSAKMLKDIGVSYSIVGHSERRHIFGETDELISKKIKSAIKNKIKPILCVGEKVKTSKERAWNFVKNQLVKDLSLIQATSYKLQATNLVVAYEPVWSISGGEPAKKVNPTHANYMVGKIKFFLNTSYKIRATVLYGGSVNSKNIKSFLKYKNIGGFLVGSASLNRKEVDYLLKVIK